MLVTAIPKAKIHLIRKQRLQPTDTDPLPSPLLTATSGPALLAFPRPRSFLFVVFVHTANLRHIPVHLPVQHFLFVPSLSFHCQLDEGQQTSFADIPVCVELTGNLFGDFPRQRLLHPTMW